LNIEKQVFECPITKKNSTMTLITQKSYNHLSNMTFNIKP